MFTLYTEDNALMENFVLYVEKILDLKNEIQLRQKLVDLELNQVIKNKLNSKQKKSKYSMNESSEFSIKIQSVKNDAQAQENRNCVINIMKPPIVRTQNQDHR
jgi:hypothetical protein